MTSNNVYQSPDPELLRKCALEQLGETDEIRKDCMARLSALLSKQEFENETWDDAVLLRFLRVSKFDVDKAFDRIKTSFVVAKKYESEKRLICTADTAFFFRNRFITLFKKLNNDRLVICFNIKQWEPWIFDSDRCFRSMWLFFERFCQDEKFVEELLILGFDIILNYNGFTMKHLFNSGVPQFLKILEVGTKLYPQRIGALHYVNVSYMVKIMYNICYPVLPSKIKKRVFMHNDLKSLHQVMDPSVLPVHLGGTGSEVDAEYLVNRFLPEEKLN